MSGVSDKTAVIDLSAEATKAPRMTMSRLAPSVEAADCEPHADAPQRMTMSRPESTRSGVKR